MRNSHMSLRRAVASGLQQNSDEHAPAPNGLAATTRDKAPLSKSVPLDLPALQAASRLIQEQLIRDAQIIPDVGDMLSGGQSSASYSIFPGDFRVPFQKRRHNGIPAALWEHFQSSRFQCHMGIMAEIERAWIALDHKLFLWDYEEGQDLSSFIEQPDVISHVSLVKPKPNVFVDEIKYLLVICTPVTVILLGLALQPVTGPDHKPRNELKLYATDMSVTTDNVEMTSVVGTSDGRVFMAGVNDGNMYELHYQEKEVWFGKRYHLINHSASGLPSYIPLLRTSQNEERIIFLASDEERNCVYSLSENNWISVWKTEPNKGLRKTHTLINLQKQAQDKAPGSPALNQGLRLLSLHVISQRESKSGIQLIALSQNGVRLYFSTSSMGYGGYGYGAPQYGGYDSRQLQLVHVRLPPLNLLHPDEQFGPQRTNAYGAAPQQPANPSAGIVKELTTAVYVNGLLVASQQSDVDGKDFIFGVAPDLSKIGMLGQAQAQPTAQLTAPTYYSQPQMNAYGQPSGARPPLTEQATLLYIEGTVWAIAASRRADAAIAASPEPLATNELAVQCSAPPQEFIIVTNVGVSHLVKRRTLEYLRDALEEAHSEGSLQPVLDFRDSYGRDQTCAMLLAVASGNTYLRVDNVRNTIYDDVGTLSPELVAIARQAFYDLSDRPIWVDRGYGGDTQGNVIFSGRREGLALYFARLVRPIWRAKITRPGPSGQESNFDDAILVPIQRNLYALQAMLDSNPQLFSSGPGEPVGRQNTEHDPWKVEQASVHQLRGLLGRTIEAISFVLLLVDYRISSLVEQCDKDAQNTIASLMYEDLIATDRGLSVSRALVNVIINSQIGQQISIDTVSEVLQQRCGSFCGADDVMLYKARENVRKAVDIKDPNEKQAILGESLRLLLRAVRAIDFEKLREICGDYQHLSYAKGVVELPLQWAAITDEDNVGLDSWLNNVPLEGPRAVILDKRRHCYDLVLHSLSVFEDLCTKNAGRQDFEEIRNHAYELAFSAEDPMFHSHLYDWMVERGMSDTLLEIRPPYLETHLQREPASLAKYELLWRLHVKNDQYMLAAQTLAHLAKSPEFEMTLADRFQCLSLAVSHAKSHPVSMNGRHESAIAFLSDLEDQLEVLKVQMELSQHLEPHQVEGDEVAEKISMLQQRLFNITELYQFYAEPFDLPYFKLYILYVSEHRDDGVVKPIWNAIFDDALSSGSQEQQADRLSSIITQYGRKFFPSESAFPLRYVSTLLVQFALRNKGVRPPGWAPRVLKGCGIPYSDIWDLFHEMYESQIPPFNEQENIQHISSDVAVLLRDWVEDARRPSSLAREELPIDLLDRNIAKYLEEVDPSRRETRSIFEDVKQQLRRYW